MDLLNSVVRAQPSAVSMKTKYEYRGYGGETALHIVCRDVSGPTTLTLVRLLCEADPRAVMVHNYRGELPLHLAAFSQTTDVVQFLIQAYPDGITHRDNFGDLPLHIACYNNAPGVIQLLVESCPHALTYQNSYDETPLHNACDAPRSFDVIELLAQNGREVLSWQDKYRCLPLHNICDNYPLQELLPYLRLHMPLLPQLIKIKNQWGKTPGQKSNFVEQVTGLLVEEASIKETMNSMESNLEAKEALQLSEVIPVASIEWLKENKEKSLKRLASIEAELNDLVASAPLP
jgi:ankyrin repeat protein